MKYAIVYMSLVILSLYAAFDFQLDRTEELTTRTIELKGEVSARTGAINLLENYRQTLNPSEYMPYGWPVELSEFRYVSSYYGFRNDPLRRNTGGNNNPFHNGADITGIRGARVNTVADGVVTVKYYEKGWHNGIWYSGHEYFNGYMEILHDDGMTSKYGHIAEILYHEGDRVKAGKQIGQISEQVDRYSTGPHLDFRLQDIEGMYVNPLLWIGESNQ